MLWRERRPFAFPPGTAAGLRRSPAPRLLLARFEAAPASAPVQPPPPSGLIARLRGLSSRGLGAVAGVLGRLGARARASVAPLLALDPATANQNRQRNDGFHLAQPAARPEPPVMAEATALAIINPALAKTPDKGHAELPADLTRLALLLGPSLGNDFLAADMVRDCFAAQGAAAARGRALLAVAIHLAQGFGSPGHLPLATLRAWRMLDPATFEDEMADQLARIGHFISNWQKSQQTFLCLDFGEIELIEYLFEAMHPVHHGASMMEVLNFKVLSNRRQGILRRVPHRLRKAVQELGVRSPEAIGLVTAHRDFLDRVATSHGFTPIMDTAALMRDEVAKLAEKLQPLPALPGIGDGQALGRITPVKMPASELAEQAIAAAHAAPPPPPIQAAPVQAAPVQAAAPPVQSAESRSVAARPSGRKPLAAGPRYSAEGRPLKPAAGIGIAARLPQPAAICITGKPPVPGKRPPLPAIAMGPMPSLVTALLPPPAVAGQIAAPPRAPAALSGRISLPGATAGGDARPVIAIRPPVSPPVSPQETRATVTPLVVVPKVRRAPITQAIKRQSVLKVLRGETAASVAASLGIRESKVDEWVDAFISAGAGALSESRRRKAAAPREAEPLSAELLRAKLAEVLATAQMIERAMEAQLSPPRRPILLPPPSQSDGTAVVRRPRKKG